MELKHTEIPVEFLRHLPEGIKLVNRHGKEFLVIEQLYGPDGTDLISQTVRLHGEPAIRLGVRVGSSDGIVFVDAYWGSHAKLYSFVPDTAKDDIVEAYVPETGKSLMVQRPCNVDGCDCTRSISFSLPGGKNHVYVCGRLGCPGHEIDIAELPQPVSQTLSSINFFGAGSLEEDWFDQF